MPRIAFLQILFDFVDDLVEAQIDAVVFGQTPRGFVRTDVETDQHRVRRACEIDVVGRDRADAAVNHANVDVLVRERLHARAQGLERTLTVGFEDEIERLLAFGRHRHERLERNPLRAGRRDTNVAAARRALFGGFASDAFVADDHRACRRRPARRRDPSPRPESRVRPS